jgi:hypothetical protein
MYFNWKIFHPGLEFHSRDLIGGNVKGASSYFLHSAAGFGNCIRSKENHDASIRIKFNN